MKIIKFGLLSLLITAVGFSFSGNSQEAQEDDAQSAYGIWIDELVASGNQALLVQGCALLSTIRSEEGNQPKEFGVSNEVIVVLRALQKGKVIQWMGNHWGLSSIAESVFTSYCKSE